MRVDEFRQRGDVIDGAETLRRQEYVLAVPPQLRQGFLEGFAANAPEVGLRFIVNGPETGRKFPVFRQSFPRLEVFIFQE